MNITVATSINTGRLHRGASAFTPSLPLVFRKAGSSCGHRHERPSSTRYASSSRGRNLSSSISARYIWTLHSFPCKDAANNPDGMTENCNLDQAKEEVLSITEFLNAHDDRDEVTLGRSESADFVLQWDHLSDKHVKFMVAGPEKENLYIEDLNGGKGTTKIDNETLPAGKSMKLEPGQIVKLGDECTFVVERNILAHA